MTTPPDTAHRFVAPPNWPQPPDGWTPPAGWQPDPAWGPAPPGWSFWQPAVTEAPVDGYAVTALVTGVMGAFFFSLVFGVAALRRIRKGLRRGRQLVFIGWGVSGLWVAALVAVALIAIGAQPQRAPDGRVTGAGTLSPMSLRVGDCVEVPPEDGTGLVPEIIDVVPCAEPHNAQMVAVIPLEADEYPGDAKITQMGLGSCEPEIFDYLGEAEPPDLRILTFVPLEADWGRGERNARCLLYDETGHFTGEARDHG